METTHENSRFRSQLLEKTIVLKSSKVRYLKSGVRFSHLTKKHNHTKIGTTVLLVALLATCTSPSYAEMGKSLFGSNSDFLTELNKISYLTLLKIQEVDYFFNQLKIQPIDTQPLITSQKGNSDFVNNLSHNSHYVK